MLDLPHMGMVATPNRVVHESVRGGNHKWRSNGVHEGSRCEQAAAAARHALDRRRDQHLVVEPRAAAPQHRPQDQPRHAALCLATVRIVGQLLNYRNRWNS